MSTKPSQHKDQQTCKTVPRQTGSAGSYFNQNGTCSSPLDICPLLIESAPWRGRCSSLRLVSISPRLSQTGEEILQQDAIQTKVQQFQTRDRESKTDH
eukprot:1098895-Amphidinium_carterae.1